ncbi:MAG: glycosyltransferase family 39 protein [Deltaproteobacteria bacterium]|nr:glycosyltransferase family 39 protein [Deltaproteobacteria bacterium]
MSGRWRRCATWIGVLVVAAVVRVPFVLRVGPNEGGGDEWYAAWRSWSVLFERGNPGSFIHPALFYEAGAALFSACYLAGALSGAFHTPVDLLADFVRNEAKYLGALQMVAAAFGALTVPVVFELGRRVGGWRAGLVGAGVLTVLPLHVQYSQRARVDSLCVLLTACSALALHRLSERGRRRDFVSSGVAIGLATAANYPAAALGVAYVAAAALARGRSTPSEWVRSFALGALAAIGVFVLTNPYVVLAPAAAWSGITFLVSFTMRRHPYMDKASDWFYLGLLGNEGALFAILAVGASAWLAIRGPGFRRILGAFPWIVFGAFALVRTREDRYILLALPWLCAGIGVLLGGVIARRRSWVAAASLVLVALTTVQLWQRTAPLALVERAGEHPRWVMQRWLLRHTPPGATIWLESDVLPLLQAVFADPGGRLQRRLRAAFLQVHPGFDARVLKGEVVERIASFDPRLIVEHEVALAVACERSLEYVRSAGPELDDARAFYAALAAHGTRRFEAMGCWIAEIAP